MRAHVPGWRGGLQNRLWWVRFPAVRARHIEGNLNFGGQVMCSVCEYFEHIEKASIEIQENLKPIDHSIILWWGLDGLQLNDDGELEWISRKNKPRPSNGLSSYEGEMEKLRELYQIASHINAPSLAMQTIMSHMQAVQKPPMPGYLGYSPYMQCALTSSIQQCCVQYPAQYPSYYYGGCCRIN